MPSLEAKLEVFRQAGYNPLPGQLEIHKDDHRIKTIHGGERASKSTVSHGELLGQYWLGDLYWLVGADYDLCRPEFGYLVDSFTKLGIVEVCHFPGRDQCSLIVTPGIRIVTKSAKYPERLAAEAPDGIVMCEAAQMSYEIFLRCIGRLAEKRGWLVAGGTFETSLDWFADKYKEYLIPENVDGGKSFSLPSWENTVIFPLGREDPEIKRLELIYGEEKFNERFAGVPARPKGLVFAEYKTTLHTGSYPLDPAHPVSIGIDPGYFPGVYAVVFAQFINDHIYIVDEIYEQYLITDEVITIAQKKPYWKNVDGGAIDIQAKQHQAQKPVIQIWEKKAGLKLDNRRIPLDDGTDRLRTFLIPHPVSGEVQIHIDSHCRGIISELGGCKPPPNIEQGGMYKMKMDKIGTVLSETPDDKHNHGIKALIYLIVSRYGLAPKRRGPLVSYPSYV